MQNLSTSPAKDQNQENENFIIDVTLPTLPNEKYDEKNIDMQVNQTGDASSNSKEKLIDEDEIRKPIDCALPLCDEINRKKLKTDSSEKNKSKNQIKKPSNNTAITIDNDLDDLL